MDVARRRNAAGWRACSRRIGMRVAVSSCQNVATRTLIGRSSVILSTIHWDSRNATITVSAKDRSVNPIPVSGRKASPSSTGVTAIIW